MCRMALLQTSSISAVTCSAVGCLQICLNQTNSSLENEGTSRDSDEGSRMMYCSQTISNSVGKRVFDNAVFRSVAPFGVVAMMLQR